MIYKTIKIHRNQDHDSDILDIFEILYTSLSRDNVPLQILVYHERQLSSEYLPFKLYIIVLLTIDIIF